MQLSYPLSQYKQLLMQSFCPLLLGIEYSSQLPNTDRLVKFLSRLKESEFDAGDPIPGLTTTDLCRTGLPVNWCYVQYNRGPLSIVEEDEFRMERHRNLSTTRSRYKEDDWGFGRTDVSCWLFGNNGSAIEAAESLYYIHLYKVRSLNYLYLGIPWKSRIIHESLGSFEPVGLTEYGTGFTITWKTQVFVPVLYEEVEGFTVQSVCNDIFDSFLCIDFQKRPPFPTPMDFDMTKSVPMNLSLHSYYDEAHDKVITQENDDRCTVEINDYQTAGGLSLGGISVSSVRLIPDYGGTGTMFLAGSSSALEVPVPLLEEVYKASKGLYLGGVGISVALQGYTYYGMGMSIFAGFSNTLEVPVPLLEQFYVATGNVTFEGSGVSLEFPFPEAPLLQVIFVPLLEQFYVATGNVTFEGLGIYSVLLENVHYGTGTTVFTGNSISSVVPFLPPLDEIYQASGSLVFEGMGITSKPPAS